MAKKIRDFQRSKVYKWEWSIIAPHAHLKVPFDQIPQIVDHVWKGSRLKNPPVVKALRKDVKNHYADSTRHRVRFHANKPTRMFILLHELAHRMNESSRGIGRGADHGPEFLGIYMNLLNKHLGVPLPVMMIRANNQKLKYDLSARPIKT